jgi:hypothetical protein
MAQTNPSESDNVAAQSMATTLTPAMLRALAAPFPSKQVSIKPLVVSDDRDEALAALFIDARDTAERLDEVAGGDWSFIWNVEDKGLRWVVRGVLTVCGVTRSDAGEFLVDPKRKGDPIDPCKSAVSDALKRCGVLFGIGRYLYRVDPMWVAYNRRASARARSRARARKRPAR